MENFKIEELKIHFRKIGFSENESKAFFAMLGKSNLTASEIANFSKIRRTDIYDILKGFVTRGIVNEIETNTVSRFELIDPKVVSDKLVKHYQEQAKALSNDTQLIFDEIAPLHQAMQINSDPKINIELVRGFNRHRSEKFIQHLKNSQYEILFMNKLEGLISTEIDELTQNFVKSGGKFKSIYEVTKNFKLKKDGKWKSVSTNELLDWMIQLENNGEEIKLTDKITSPMAIFDREYVYLNINDPDIPKFNKNDIYIRNRDFAEFMSYSFELIWNDSKTISEFKNLSNNTK